MGPITLVDYVGLTRRHAADVMYEEFREPGIARTGAPAPHGAGGPLGTKDGRGFYQARSRWRRWSSNTFSTRSPTVSHNHNQSRRRAECASARLCAIEWARRGGGYKRARAHSHRRRVREVVQTGADIADWPVSIPSPDAAPRNSDRACSAARTMGNRRSPRSTARAGRGLRGSPWRAPFALPPTRPDQAARSDAGCHSRLRGHAAPAAHRRTRHGHGFDSHWRAIDAQEALRIGLRWVPLADLGGGGPQDGARILRNGPLAIRAAMEV